LRFVWSHIHGDGSYNGVGAIYLSYRILPSRQG
jgi:hypothetical protein